MPRVIVRETAAELPSDLSALGGLFEGDIAFALNTDIAYYWDGAAWIPFTGGTAPAPWTEVELDFGDAKIEKTFTVVDAGVSPTSKITMVHSGAAATGKQADEAEFDAIDCRCEPLTGSFRVYATSLLGHVQGLFKFNYVVQP
jgi:hypothetical protein